MRDAGLAVTPSNPFDKPVPMIGGSRTKSPYALRLRAMWVAMREEVIQNFPDPPGVRMEPEDYLRTVDGVFKSDAYNSLSIEGYVVDDDLIERVRQGRYDPDQVESDKQQRDALAARGYYEAFQLVRAAIAKVLSGEDAATVVRTGHRDWNYAMCSPAIRAGVMKPTGAVGYRNNIVMINGSDHVPPPFEAVVDSMEALFDLLGSEPHPAVRAVLGHFMFGFIHPYPDRNGRISRFLMNVMLSSSGYPWTVVQVKHRARYMTALEDASCRGDIQPFVEFIADQMSANQD
jgi:Fic family protein